MQLLATEDYYFIKSVRTILRCCRLTSKLSIAHHHEIAVLEDLQVYGDIFCYFGKIVVDHISYLILVTERSEVAKLEHYQSVVYRVDKVCALPLVKDGFIHSGLFTRNAINDGLTRLKNHHKKIVKFVSDKVSTNVKFIDEIVRFINESSNFYFSTTVDLTVTIQKRSKCPGQEDLRFFWNRQLINSFYDDNGKPRAEFSEWITPVIYGYVSQKEMTFEPDTSAYFTLISRRSVCRAGVRYLRRGADKNGDVANFVETEYIIHVFGHCLSYVQVRGSVPIFWSQKGYRFRPPLSIDRPMTESLPVLETHIFSLINEYGSPIVIISLVEQRGRELCLGEAYLQHILELNSPDVVFLSFDFHQNCKSLRFHKVYDLVSAIDMELTVMGFCWLDKNGQMVREQKGVIRTNCVDCLDRTNVVQSAIAQAICINQARKLGLIEPEGDEFDSSRVKHLDTMVKLIQGMWADHGDCISKQYAGTNALKGDVTRGGQRKLIGFMKDGYNSASRYYLSHVHDAQRQRIIDALLSGQAVNAAGGSITSSTSGNVDASSSASVSDENRNSTIWYRNDDLINMEAEDVMVDDDEEEEEELDSDGRRFPRSSSMGAIMSSSGSGSKLDGPKGNNCQSPRVGAVWFDSGQEAVASSSDWVLVDAVRQRIAESRTKIVML